MHRILGIIGSVAAVLGFLLMLNMFWASANNGGMAVLGLQIFGAIAALAGAALGGLGLLLARGKDVSHGFCNFAFGIGLGTLLALLIAYLFL